VLKVDGRLTAATRVVPPPTPPGGTVTYGVGSETVTLLASMLNVPLLAR
jgi:hypothetical protein